MPFFPEPTTDTSNTTQITHTFAVAGEIKVPSGATDFIPPMYIGIPEGQITELVGVNKKIQSGTSVTFDVRVNGVAPAGWANLTANTTLDNDRPASVELDDGDEIAIVVTAVSGTPKNLSVSLLVNHQVE